jgi:hypothetical protein
MNKKCSMKEEVMLLLSKFEKRRDDWTGRDGKVH